MRRKYITLTSTIIFIIFFILNLFTRDINDWSKHYFEFPVLIFQLILCYFIFKASNNDNKNILTAMNVIITILYILLYIYSIVVELDLENLESQ